MRSNHSHDLLDPPTLAQFLRSAGLSRGTSSDTDTDAAATRIALDTVEKTAALLRAP